MAFAVMFAPVADAAVCADETPPAAAKHVDSDAAAPTDVIVAVNDEHGRTAQNLGDEPGLCQHGHCHHAAPYLPILVTEVAVWATSSGPVAALQTQHLRSHTGSRLERPPRA